MFLRGGGCNRSTVTYFRFTPSCFLFTPSYFYRVIFIPLVVFRFRLVVFRSFSRFSRRSLFASSPLRILPLPSLGAADSLFVRSQRLCVVLFKVRGREQGEA
jgi:hypothetical protein